MKETVKESQFYDIGRWMARITQGANKGDMAEDYTSLLDVLNLLINKDTLIKAARKYYKYHAVKKSASLIDFKRVFVKY